MSLEHIRPMINYTGWEYEFVTDYGVIMEKEYEDDEE